MAKFGTIECHPMNGETASEYADCASAAPGFAPDNGLCPEYPNPQNVVTSYYFSDAQGNVVALVLPNGFLAAQYKYDPFGNLISKSGLLADINKYRFSSKEWEQNAGLYYYGYRFYDPNLQRWLNRDPNGEPGFSVLQNPGNYSENSQEHDILGLLNLYLFANNNGLNFIDTDGLLFITNWWNWLWDNYLDPDPDPSPPTSLYPNPIQPTTPPQPTGPISVDLNGNGKYKTKGFKPVGKPSLGCTIHGKITLHF